MPEMARGRMSGRALVEALRADVLARERAALASVLGPGADLDEALELALARYRAWAFGADDPALAEERATRKRALDAIEALRAAVASSPAVAAELGRWVEGAPPFVADGPSSAPLRRLVEALRPPVPGPGAEPLTDRRIAEIAVLAGVTTDAMVRGGERTLAEGWRSIVAAVRKARRDCEHSGPVRGSQSD